MWHASFGVLTMNKFMIGSMAALAMVAGAASPAAARPYWGGGYYGGYHRHGGGDAFGNFLLGAIVAGGAVAIASNAGKNSGSRAIPSRGIDDVRGAGEDARAVASICSDAAESMAHGKVLGVDSVGRDGDGWRVEGTVEADRGDRYFSCGAREGRVDFLKLGDFASR
jgi:hypothetical protein